MSNIGLCKEEIIINKIGEITKSLCKEFVGLSATINSDVRQYKDIYSIHPSFRSIEISFIYNPDSYNYTKHIYTIYPYDIFDLDMFAKAFRKEVIKEVINDKDKFERTYRRDINEQTS